MRALVTGGAGFIGSTLCERLAGGGWDVVAVDSLNAYYDPELKRKNIQRVLRAGSVEFIEADLSCCDLDPMLDGVEVVFHLAGQPGVRLSWSTDFGAYVTANVMVTQRLLESARSRDLHRFVFSSSSSVYGDQAPFPSAETDLTVPFSPYGVTKLAAELLGRAYAANFSVPVVALRYFTVYGPRQRPDMAISLLMDRVSRGQTFTLFGDGSQLRDFTFVDDVVEANVLAATTDTVLPGDVFNVAGGASASMSELVAMIEDTIGMSARVVREPDRPGDVRRTGADTSRARESLGWEPCVGLQEGLKRQWEWLKAARG